MLEGHATGKVGGHHDHPGDPEKNDVVTGHQYGAGQIQVVIRDATGRGGRAISVGLRVPLHGAERHQRRRVPSVQYVGVAAQCAGVPGSARLGDCVGFVGCNIDAAIFGIPRRDLMAPPQLAADAPVLNVVHPLVVGVDPVFWHEGDRTRVHCVNGFLCDGATVLGGGAAVVLGGLVHRDKPLVGQHRFHHLAGAGANGQHQFVGLDFDQQANRFEVLDDGLAGVKTVQALVGGRAVVVDFGIERKNGDQRQAVALGAGVVVKVVGAGNFDAARAEGAVNEVVRNDRNFSIAQRQVDHLSNQMAVAIVFGMHRQCTVRQHRLRPRGSNRHALLQRAINRLRTVRERVADVMHFAVGFGAFDL